jgi:hypothetical protein
VNAPVCSCPDMPRAGIVPIPPGPVTCVCCGEPLILTCAGKCGTKHVARSMARIESKRRRIRFRYGRAYLKPKRHCIRCQREITPNPNGGRRPNVCDGCLTPAERQLRDAQRLINEAKRALTREAVP